MVLRRYVEDFIHVLNLHSHNIAAQRSERVAYFFDAVIAQTALLVRSIAASRVTVG